jgi:C_GCAxxG_C_C family probable redox protein
MSKVEQAVSCFEEGFSCAQAVLSTYGSQSGLDREMALRVAGAFGGGMARMGRTCGAVTGALMVIGLERGSTRADDEEAKEACYDLVGELVRQFEVRNGAITCNELLGHDISNPEESALAREQGIYSTLCPKLVRDAAEIVERIIGGKDGD